MQAREEQAADGFFGGNGESGIFGQGSNLFSNVFDGAACIVSSVIGGGNPKCQGRGSAVVKPPSDGGKKPGNGDDNSGDHESAAYNYTYDTNKDGSLKVTVTLQRGGSCTYDIKADGEKVQDAISEAAKKCLAEKK